MRKVWPEFIWCYQACKVTFTGLAAKLNFFLLGLLALSTHAHSPNPFNFCTFWAPTAQLLQHAAVPFCWAISSSKFFKEQIQCQEIKFKTSNPLLTAEMIGNFSWGNKWLYHLNCAKLCPFRIPDFYGFFCLDSQDTVPFILVHMGACSRLGNNHR